MQNNKYNAIIPNKDDLLSLTKLAREITAGINKQGDFPASYCTLPLWIISNDIPQDIKSIKSITIKKIDLGTNENTSFTDTLIYSAEITLQDLSIQKTEIPFTRFLQPLTDEQKKIPVQKYCPGTLPLKLKIFRAGSVTIENNQYRLFNERWIKIKDSLK